MSPFSPYTVSAAMPPDVVAWNQVCVEGRYTATTVGLSTPLYCACTGTSPPVPKTILDVIAPVGPPPYQVEVDGRNTPMWAKPSPAVRTVGTSPATPKWNLVG